MPLIAVRAGDAPPPEHHYYPKEVSFPVTAFFRFDGGLAELGERRTGRLELYNPLTIQAIEVRGRSVPLETDLTTPLAYFLANTDLETAAYLGFLRADTLQGRYGIYMLEPYQPGKIPVVLVHGLLSSPLTWMPMFNDLRADPELRDRFQFWFYFYPTGDPYLATAADLRARPRADCATTSTPTTRTRALDQMVLVGHSMGGLISKLLTVDSGDDFWREVSDRPFGDLTLKPETRRRVATRLLTSSASPCVKRVIFLGTPHHGSRLSPSPLGRLGDELVRLPKDLMDAAQDAAAENPGQPVLRKFEQHPDERGPAGPRGAVAGAAGVAAAPGPACITTRSSASCRRPGRCGSACWAAATSRATASCPTTSAHLDDAESELIVPADHFHVHQHPLAVLEIRRILLEHAEESERGAAGVRPVIRRRSVWASSARLESAENSVGSLESTCSGP